MIPKILHYCWFGKGKHPQIIDKCINSWKEKLPEYEVMLWNEESFDISSNQYVKEAYENKKYAFVTDYVRLYVLYTYGGIYMDTDVQVIRPIDRFLDNEAFSGFEKKDSIPTGIMGAEKGNKCIKELLAYYDNRSFFKADGTMDLTTNVYTITRMLLPYGLKLNGKEQIVNGFHLYPQKYFCPNTIEQVFKMNPISRNTYVIHHCGGGWGRNGKKDQRFGFRVKRYFSGLGRNIIGTGRIGKLGKTLSRIRKK